MIEFNLTDYKTRIIHNAKGRRNIVKCVLIQGTYEEISKYYNATPVGIKGVYKYYLQYLKCKSYGGLYKTSGLYLKEPIDFVGLLTFIIPYFSSEINEYLSLKIKFEEAYLLGNYSECKRILKLSNDISFSVWAAINEIKIAELEGGLEKRMEVYNRIVSENKIHSMLKYVLSQAQETASIEASQQPFVENRYNDICNSNFKEKWQYDYLIGTILPFYDVEAGKWLSFNMKSSIIDVYNTFRDNFHLIIKNCKDDSRLLNYLQIILKYVKDERLDKFYGLLSKTYINNTIRKELLLQDSLNDKHADYCKSIPHDIDMLVHYVSLCAIYGRMIGNDKGNIFERIQYHLYKYLQKENSNLHYRKLEMICLSNHTLLPLRQLYNIIKNIEERNLHTISLKYWEYSYGYNIQDACFFIKTSDKLHYLTNTLEFPEPYFDSKKELSISMFHFLSVLPTSIDEKMTSDLEYMISYGKLPLYTMGAIVSYLLAKYLEKNEFKKMIYLYVDAYLNNRNIKILLDNELVEKFMTRKVDIEINAPLELSIFYYLINAKPAKIAANAQRYLKTINVQFPSQINNYEDVRVLFFLENVVDEKILDYFPIIFDDVTDSMQERINICRKLKSRYNEGKRFSNEISRLTREIAVIKNLKHVNASKIDVDTNLLKKTELSNAREMFEMYKNTPDSVMYLFDLQSLRLMFPNEFDDMQDENLTTNECVQIPYRQFLFTQYYLCVRDVFLLNNTAGLDYFLSSRIRHGTIVNQLRKDFQEKKLTTRKNTEGGYDMNTYWAEDVFNLQGPNFIKVLEIFKNFTEEIDKQISVLKNLKIQVKTETYNVDVPACFDFSHSKLQERIYQLYKKDSNQYEYSIDEVLESLWDYTESRFLDVKEQVKIAKEQMESALDSLKNEIYNIVDCTNKGLVLFRDAITTCHTQLENNIEIVANWFQRSQSMGMEFSFLDLINTAIKGINSNSDIQLTVEQTISSHSKIKGRYLGVLYTLMHNIYSNVVEYYERFSAVSAICETRVDENDDKIIINVINRIREEDKDTIIEALNEFKLARTKKNMNDKVRNDKNSGFYKMSSIVINHLGTEDNYIDFNLNDCDFSVNIDINIKNIKI